MPKMARSWKCTCKWKGVCLFMPSKQFFFIVSVPIENTEQIGGPGRSHLISILEMRCIICTHLLAISSAFQLSTQLQGIKCNQAQIIVSGCQSCFEREMVINKQLIYKFRNLLHHGQREKVKTHAFPDMHVQPTLLCMELQYSCILFP